MARIRTIKPEFPQSETIGRLSRDARLLFIQLWTVCDDYGRTRAAPPLLAGQLYPYDTDAAKLLPKWLAELASANCVRLYKVGGDSYLEVVNWGKHQRVDNAGKSNIPPPSASDPEPASDVRGEIPRAAADLGEPPPLAALSLGPGRDQEGTKDQEHAASAATPESELAQVLDGNRARAVVDHRKKLRKPLTPYAARLLASKFRSCPEPNAAADAMIANGWQGIDPTWIKSHDKPNGSRSGDMAAAALEVGERLQRSRELHEHPGSDG